MYAPRTPHQQDGRQGTALPARRHAGRGRRQLRRLLAPRHRHLPAAVRFGRTAKPPTSSRLDASRQVRLARRGEGRRRRASCTATRRAATIGRQWGLRFNDAKLLLDPYAKAVHREVPQHRQPAARLRRASRAPESSFRTRATTPRCPRKRSSSTTTPSTGRATSRPIWRSSSLFIYEVHVKGFTAHPSSRVRSPGTYLGFIEKIPHLQRLGVNAVELLPVHEFYVDDFLIERGLDELLGLQLDRILRARVVVRHRRQRPGVRSPSSRRSSGRCIARASRSFSTSSTTTRGEGNELGPSLSFRGLDNPSYYSLTGPREAPLRYYMNFTGCGNSLNFDSPAVIRLVMDSLRYWVEVMHVDGFRFDLASVLGRCEDGSFRSSASVLRRRVPGPGAQPRDPHRRALGHRHVPGRQLSRGLVGVERPLPRHGPALRQGRRRSAGRPGLAPHRDPPICTATMGDRPTTA